MFSIIYKLCICIELYIIYIILFIIGEGFELKAPEGLELETPPTVPPRRKDRKQRNSPPKQIINGLPPTPKVHMGACFSKVKVF